MRLKPSDLRIKHQCTKCQHWMTVHAVPWGEPLALLVTGYCFRCGASYMSLREATGEGVAGAAQQLVDHFTQVVPGVVRTNTQTRN